MTDNEKERHCYIDHANKKSEAYGETPYLFWLNQIRRNKERTQQRGAADSDVRADTEQRRTG